MPLASHDDTTPEHVAEAARDGVAIAEFPTTVEAAAALHRAGVTVMMGAPNLVRGGSHSGNVAAVDLAAHGVLDILSSDYVPASLLMAALQLPEAVSGIDLAAAVRTVTKTPARRGGARRPRRDRARQAGRPRAGRHQAGGAGGAHGVARRQAGAVTMHGREATRPSGLGPGIFVGVMGPSGAGKDTLIDLARAALAGRPDVVFVRRVVTRPSDGSEDHLSTPPEAFVRAAALGAFALSWHAHGHDYGLPVELDGDIRAGRVVVANISRDVTVLARARYQNARLVHVTAPPDVLAARRAARHRASEAMEEGASRIERVAVQVGLGAQDIEIINGGPRETAAEQLVEFLTALLDGRAADRDCDGSVERG